MPMEAEGALITEITVNKESEALICMPSPFLDHGGVDREAKKNGQQEKGETVRTLDNPPLDN